MGAMIQNDDEKEWMLPLLEFRNEMDFRSEEDRKKDRSRREFRRMNGQITYFKDRDDNFRLVPGPYTQETREYWLRRLLEVQKWIQDNGPDYVSGIQLVTAEELKEIRRHWVMEKHEIEDVLPKIYEEVMEIPYSGVQWDSLLFDKDTLSLLKDTCGGAGLQYELARNLLDVERRFRTMTRRQGLFDALEKELSRCFYVNEEDALCRAKTLFETRNETFVSSDGRNVDFDLSDLNLELKANGPKSPLLNAQPENKNTGGPKT